MQTLTQNPLEFREVHDTEYRLFINGQNVGRIAFNITAMRWEYNPYGQPVRAVGTLEHCCDVATDELMPRPESLAKVIAKGPKSRPSGFYSDCKYISRNRVQRLTIGGLDDSWTDDLWVPLSLANQLKEGSVVVPSRPDGLNGGLYLKWPQASVRRSAVAA